MEFYANQRSGDNAESEEFAFDDETEGEEEVDESSFDAWKACQSHLTRLRARNDHLRRETQGQALELLRYSRPLLLHSSLNRESSVPSATTPPGQSSALTLQDPDIFPFMRLPMELQLSILALLAPSLSSAQRSRIFSYAASASTLPPLLPFLNRIRDSDECLPDPALLTAGHCNGGRCPGMMNMMVSCNKDKERARWLNEMGCSSYDPEESPM
jgi:hypothetical protein